MDAHATRSSSSRTASQPTNALVVNTRILILGHQYQLTGLQQLAGKKYIKALQFEGLTDSFTESLVLLYRASFPQDRLIKSPAIYHAALRYPTLIKLASFRSLLQKDGNMGFRILKAAAERPPGKYDLYFKGSCY